MEIKIIRTGFLNENCYLLIKNNECLIIDPGADFFNIKKELKNLNIVAVLITHRHFDHIGALNELINTYEVNVYDKSNLKEGSKTINSFTFETIYTPGHSSDSISFYFKNENAIFVGDFIFKNSIGRWDLETGNKKELETSLQLFIDRFKRQNNLIIYPGHGEYTTYNSEINNNPFLDGLNK